MTGEEMERAIEFLLQSHANLEAQVAETGRQLQTYAEAQSVFIETVTRSLEGQDKINANLRAADARTDERLNKLIGLFEQHISTAH
jgi:hypothetical protein